MQTNFEVKLRFAPNEKFYQTKSQRFPINLDAPVLTLSHNFAFKISWAASIHIIIPNLGFRNVFGSRHSVISMLL